MDPGLQLEMKSNSFKGNVDVPMYEDADVPSLSVTAPSAEVSQEQSPVYDAADEVRCEAEKLIGDVLNQAAEILETRTHSGGIVVKGETTEITNKLYDDNDGGNNHRSDVQETIFEFPATKTQQNGISEDVRKVADKFVHRILTGALEEANKRLMELRQVHVHADSSQDNLPETTAIVGESCDETSDKRRPWYNRARTSVRKLLYRLCICGGEHR